MAIKLKNVIIVGAGGHAKVVADALISHPRNGLDYTVVGFVDDDPAKAHATIEGRPVLGPVSELERLKEERPDLAVVVGIGDNATRHAVFDDIDTRGFEFVNAIHRSAVLADTIQIGRGVLIAAGVVVNSDARIGDDVILNTGCTVDHDVRVSDHCHIAPGVNLCGAVKVGASTMIGVGASVLPNVIVGEAALVAAGAAVTKDVADRAKVGGVPAKEL